MSFAEPAELKTRKEVTNHILPLFFHKYLLFPANSAASSEAGERKKTLSLAEPTGIAEKKMNAGFRSQASGVRIQVSGSRFLVLKE